MAYANMVCDYGPFKKEKCRVRLTLGGDVLDYDGNASALSVSLLEENLLLNSIISNADVDARFPQNNFMKVVPERLIRREYDFARRV